MTFPKVSGEFAMAPVTSVRKLATDVPGAVEYTNQSRSALYDAMRRGLLLAYKRGAHTILFYDDLDRYMHAMPRAQFKPLADEADADGVGEPAEAEPVAAATPDPAAAAKQQLEELSKDRN